MLLDCPLPLWRKGSRHTWAGRSGCSWPRADTLSLLRERLTQPALFSRFPSVTTGPARHPGNHVNFLSLFFLPPTKKPLSPLNSKSLVKGLSGLDSGPSKVSMAFPSYQESGFPRKGLRFSCRLPGLYCPHTHTHPHIQGDLSFWPLTECPPHPVLSQGTEASALMFPPAQTEVLVEKPQNPCTDSSSASWPLG